MAAVVIIKLEDKDSADGWTDVATLVRRALAEVCTDPLLLVENHISRMSHAFWCPLFQLF